MTKNIFTFIVIVLALSTRAHASHEADAIDHLINLFPSGEYQCKALNGDNYTFETLERDYVWHHGIQVTLVKEGVESSYINLAPAYDKETRSFAPKVDETQVTFASSEGITLVRSIPDFMGTGRYEEIKLSNLGSSVVSLDAKRVDKRLFIPYRETKIHCSINLTP
jgi:hypothetical protein